MGKLKNKMIEQEESTIEKIIQEEKGQEGKVDNFLFVEGLDKAVAESLDFIRIQDSEGNVIEFERRKEGKL